jgi:hypothetical protein
MAGRLAYGLLGADLFPDSIFGFAGISRAKTQDDCSNNPYRQQKARQKAG